MMMIYGAEEGQTTDQIILSDEDEEEEGKIFKTGTIDIMIDKETMT